MVECEYFRFGCNAKLPAFQLMNLAGYDNISYLADDSQSLKANHKLYATIDTVFPCSPCPASYARAAFFHCVNDLVAAKSTPTDCLVSAGLGSDITHEEQVIIFNEISSLAEKFEIKLVNQHTYISDKTSLTFTFIGTLNHDKDDTKIINGELDIILTKPLGSSFFLLHALNNLDVELELLTTKCMTASPLDFIPLLTPKCLFLTDVSGFGFIGHLTSLSNKYCLECKIDIDRIEIISSIDKIVISNDLSTSKTCNFRDFSDQINCHRVLSNVLEGVLYSGETNGPIIIFAEKDYSNKLLLNLNKYTKAHVIGKAFQGNHPKIDLY